MTSEGTNYEVSCETSGSSCKVRLINNPYTRANYTFKGWNGKNLFNKDATVYKVGYYIKGDGTFVSNVPEYDTYQVSVSPNKSYTIVNCCS